MGIRMAAALVLAGACLLAALQTPTFAAMQDEAAVQPDYDQSLAERLGADDYGMRSYVLVILRSGPTPMPAGPEREAMFRGHLDNIRRLAEAGSLVLAGPLDGVDGRRGIFVLAVPDIDSARRLVETDPVIANGEMSADFHVWYGSAALMQLPELHGKVARRNP
ncbi:YciI family protein [Denitratimonas sp. CY0512]|uniref:YciI family protein n=1 Tax=Denitratimonas sp. CY0512 TaxID=3131940 RepID=UPI0030B16123